jgi:hypothetical protein
MASSSMLVFLSLKFKELSRVNDAEYLSAFTWKSNNSTSENPI